MEAQQNGLLYLIGIKLIPGIGDVNGKRLLAWCGSAEAVFRESSARLRRIPGIGNVLAGAVKSSLVLQRAEQEMASCHKMGIQICTYLEEGYPSRLRDCEDGPMVLFVKGKPDFDTPRILAVVGTREATSYGLARCQAIVEGLSASKVMVVSGLAYGIDAEAHRSSLSSGLPTLAVLAHGLDRVYPPAHARLARRMVENGGLVTEFMSGETPEKVNFPRRNRIIAGLSDAVLVVEAASTGGALITAEMASSYNRDVFALPGRVGDRFSEGCLNLIKNNKAALICSAEDILGMMNWDHAGSANVQQRLFPLLEPEEQRIMDLLSPAGVHIDTLTLNLGLQPGKMSAMLLEMEFKGLIRVLPGNRYAPADRGRCRTSM